jgi:hypothetical protein
MTRGNLVVSTPSPSIQVPIVNRYGSQMVYCSPMTHGPFSSLRSISSTHSVMVARTLRFIASIAAGDALCRHAAPRFAGHRRFFRDAEKMGLDQNPRKTTLTLS